jgi:hypothetical protein
VAAAIPQAAAVVLVDTRAARYCGAVRHLTTCRWARRALLVPLAAETVATVASRFSAARQPFGRPAVLARRPPPVALLALVRTAQHYALAALVDLAGPVVARICAVAVAVVLRPVPMPREWSAEISV